MTFGKYKGREVSTLPGSYLTWLRTVPTIRDAALRAAIEVEAERRRASVAPSADAQTLRTDSAPEQRGVVIDFAAAAARLRRVRPSRVTPRGSAREHA